MLCIECVQMTIFGIYIYETGHGFERGHSICSSTMAAASSVFIVLNVSISLPCGLMATMGQ